MTSKGHSFIRMNDLSNENIERILKSAQTIRNNPSQFSQACQGQILGLLFFEPSTRTYFSFATAMQRLGGNVCGFSDNKTTSTSKGETLEDTVRTMSLYTDILAIRHGEMGALARAVDSAEVPVISAGEGTGEHPTQTMTDLLTIYDRFQRFDVTVGLYGDLCWGRTAHSLILAGSRLGMRFVCIAPPLLQMPQEYLTEAAHLTVVKQTENIQDVIADLDVLYVTRLQRERLPETTDTLTLQQNIQVNQALVDRMKPEAIILHPLPRTQELDPVIDKDPRAFYFTQVKNGMWVRMALLLFCLSNTHQQFFY